MTKKSVTQLGYEIIGYEIKVHKALGPGLLESVYQKCLEFELLKQGVCCGWANAGARSLPGAGY